MTILEQTLSKLSSILDPALFTQEVMILFCVEILLVLMTAYCLLQPRFIYEPKSEGLRGVLTFVGVIFLCVTFCWSFLLGAIYRSGGSFWA